MRLIWNAGVALTLTGILTVFISFGSVTGQTAQAVQPWAGLQLTSDTPHRHYSGLQEHFRAANVSNDGHLTLDQARQAGWNRIVSHFAEIDVDHFGFVTYDQVHAYNLAQRHGRKSGPDV